jgi:signal transduction histidine kinase
MIRWYKKYASRRFGFTALGFGAVLLPLLLLSVVQYRSLVDLEDKTKVAVRENLSRTLERLSRRTRENLESMAAESLGRIDPVAIQQRSLDQLANQLLNIRRERPEIEAVFIVNRCSTQKESFAVFAVADGVRPVNPDSMPSDAQTQTIVQIYNQAELLQTPIGAQSKFLFEQTSCPLFSSGEGGPSQLVILTALRGMNSADREVIAGLVLNSEPVGRKFLPQSARELLQESGETTGLLVGVMDEKGQEIYTSRGASRSGQGRYEVTMPLTPVFRRWKSGAGYADATTQTLAKKQFRQNLALSVIALTLLVGGVALTLRAATREKRLVEAKSSFVSNVSHEMKTPLASIRLFAETLELGRVKGPEEMQEYGRIISRESVRLTQLIDNILDFSRIEAGKREYQFAETNLGEILMDALRSYEPQLRNEGFRVDLILEPNLPPAMVDRQAITQAVLNLLDNAIRYSAEVKRIEARAERRGDGLAIEIADRGIGLHRSEQQKIFEKFYRVDAGLVHNTKGSGLGLAIVKHIVEAHCGRILVESAPGEGCRFTILFPHHASADQRI